GRVEALVEICVEVEGFLRRGERELHVPDVQRCGGAAKEGPDQGVRVAQQTRRLDATVEQLPGLGELAAQAPEPAQGRDQNEQEFALAGRPRHGQGAGRVRLAVGVPAEIELRTGETGGRLEVAGELVVRE